MSTSESTPESIQPGMLFCDRYRVERRLDDGGMATIYLATDEDEDCPVAIKVLFDRYSDNEVVRARFLDEGRIQAMLDHPNIVHVHRVITEPVLCFVMEYVDGETLEEYLQENSPLQEAEIVDLMMPVMSAIGFAHNKGIVHRDLKPSNVLLDQGGAYLEPKVMDFGVAKISRGKELTIDGTTVGTLHYMSPEQIVGSSDIDGRADIYSLGCSLYKLCTGDVPFNASSEFALMMAHVEADPTPPSELRPDLSPGMEEIIMRALEKKPEQRFQTIREMTARLMELVESDDDRITITRPIPGHLLQFAMDADEVANDKTQEMRLEHLIGAIDDGDTVESDVAAQTHELSAAALRRIEEDRLQKKGRQKRDGRSLSKIETIERDRPASRADEESETRQKVRDDSLQSDTREKELDQLTTRPTTTVGSEELVTPSEQETTTGEDGGEKTSTSERPETVPLPEFSLPEKEAEVEGDDTTERIEDDPYYLGETNPYEPDRHGEVDSQEVTAVLSRQELDTKRRRDDLSVVVPDDAVTGDRTVEERLPSVLRGEEPEEPEQQELGIIEEESTTIRTPRVPDEQCDPESTAAERPTARALSRPGDDGETDTLEDRPRARFGATDTSEQTAGERPALRLPKERDSSPSVESSQDVEERPAVKLKRAHSSSSRPTTDSAESDDGTGSGSNTAVASDDVAQSAPLPGDEDIASEAPDGASMVSTQEQLRQATQSTEVDDGSSSNLIWAVAGIVALLFAIAILVAVQFFL